MYIVVSPCVSRVSILVTPGFLESNLINIWCNEDARN